MAFHMHRLVIYRKVDRNPNCVDYFNALRRVKPLWLIPYIYVCVCVKKKCRSQFVIYIVIGVGVGVKADYLKKDVGL